MKTTLFTLIICLLSVQTIFAEGIEPIDSDSNGKREVSSLEHLLWITTTPEALAYDYEQTTDIDASATQYWDDNDDDSDGNFYNDPNDSTNEGNNEGWLPIGDNIDPFTGSYDGQNHVITGLTINRAANFQGLFGHTDNATIENLGLEDGSISGSYYIGSLAGIVANTSVSNCYNTGNVSGNTEVGGLIGRVYISTVNNCYTTGNVNALSEAGGLVGQNRENSIITNSYASGQVYASQYRAGGLVGSNIESTVDACYATGNVNAWQHAGGLAGENNSGMLTNSSAIGAISGSEYVGGLAGSMWNAEINKSYATGDVTVSTNRAGGLIGDLSGTSAVSNSYSLGNITRTEGSDTIVGAFIGYTHPSSIISYCYTIGSVYYDNDDDPTDKGFAGLDDGATFTSNYWDSQVSNQNTAVGASGRITQDMKIQHIYTYSGWDFVGETTNGVDDTWDIASNGQASYPFLSAIAPEILPGLEDIVFAGGDGSPENPYLIENLTHLKNTRHNLNASYEQIADIDASETATWDDGNGGNAEGWMRIGDYYSRFFGTYNGKNHTITGLTINRSGTAYQGLFGYIEGATIDSLGIENCDITGKWHVGAFAGYAYNNSLISHCYSKGTVSGYQEVGGLFGDFESSELKQSFSSANVFVVRTNGGGLIGFAKNGSQIKNCYARGNVTRTGSESFTHFGAFMGVCTNTDVEFCYATGSVFYEVGDDPVDNGFVIYHDFSNFNGNFWDSELSNQNTAIGATAQTTANMKTQSTFTNTGWDFMLETTNGTEDYWGINLEDNEGYPFLKFQGYKLHTEVSDWPVASNLDCGQPLNESTLTGGSASVEGIFTFTNPDEVPVFGTFDYEVAFHPTDNENYATIYGTVSVTVEDNISPEIISSHPDQILDANDDCQAILPNYTIDVIANDNCDDNLTISQSPEPGTPIAGEVNTVTLTVVDHASNTADVSFNVIVSDNTIPEITSTHPDQTLDADDDCQAILPDYTIDVVAFDNCTADLTINQLPEPGTPIAGEINTVTITVVDLASNTADVSFNVIVADNTIPEITSTHPDQMLEVNDNCEASLPDYTIDVVAFDNCTASLTINQLPEPGSDVNVGDEIMITLTVTDDAGNAAEISFNTSVIDTTFPTIDCVEDQTVDENSEGMYLVSGNIFDPVSTDDNCSVYSVENDFNSLSTLDGAEFPVGTTTVNWTVIDGSGNESSCSFNVTVNATTGITSYDNSNISVFPNPASHNLTIVFAESAPSEEIVISLTDILGHKVLSKVVKTYPDNRNNINISNLRKGIYLLTINYNKGSYTKIIVKE